MAGRNAHIPDGVFITIEGGDGAGKTTQAAHLADALRSLGCTVCHVHDPGGTQLGDRIRAVLLDTGLQQVNPRAELLLYEAARAQLVDEVIRPALARGEVVVSDRFSDSTTAYQGYGRGLDISMVEQLNAFATQGAVPTCTVLLTLDSDLGIARATAHTQADRMEAAGETFHRCVCAGFGELAQRDAGRFSVVDASASPDVVQQCVWQAVEPVLQAAGQLGGGR